MRTIGIIGLGLVASGRRNIRSGYEYDKLYAKNELLGTNPIIGGDLSDTYDTLNHMAKIVRETLNDTKQVAITLIGGTLEQTLRNNWNHVFRHFQYKKDAMGIEQLRRPSRSWKDRQDGIDCDCMVILLSSLLHWQKISHTFRKAQYNSETGWQHVYVVVPKPGVSVDTFDKYSKVPRDKYYVLDCVVDKFNYEVPFIKKFDKAMKIQYLNGLDHATLNGGVTSQLAMAYNPVTTAELLAGFGCEFDGLHGLGESLTPGQVQSLFLRGLKQHLVNTRSVIAINPSLTAGIYEPALFMQRLDALIASFDAGTLGRTLLDLSEIEEREQLNGLGNQGLGLKFFKKIAAGVKKVAQKVKAGVKKAGQNIKAGAKVIGKKLAETAKKAAKFVVRYNPATIAVRNGLLLAMKLNLFRMAEKLGYGYWTESQAVQAGLDVNEWRKNKSVLDKARNIHKKIGGKLDKFDNAVKKGWEHGVKKHNLPTLTSTGTVAKPTPPASTAPRNTGIAPPKLTTAKQAPASPKPMIRATIRPTVLKKPLKVSPKVAIVSRPVAKPTAKRPLRGFLGEAANRITSTMPLLHLINEQLSALQFKSVLRKDETSEFEEFMQAVRTNRGGIATKLSLAYKPVNVANQYDKNEYQKLLGIAQLAEKMVKQRGGTPQQLLEAVNAGKQVALSQENLGELTTAMVTAAAGALAAIGAALKSVNFKFLFKGKADSPQASESEIKNSHVTAPVDDDTFDEGDPSVSVPEVPAPAPKKSGISNLITKLVNSPTVSLIKNIAPVLVKNVVASMTAKQASELAKKIQGNPSLKDTAMAQELEKVANEPIQEAQVIETRPLEEKDNTVMYVAIGTGVALALATAGYFILRKPASARQLGSLAPEPKQDPAPVQDEPALSGVKKVSKRSSQRGRKVMAIII